MKLYNPYESSNFFVGFGSVVLTVFGFIVGLHFLDILFPLFFNYAVGIVLILVISYVLYRIIKYIFTGK